MSVKWPRLAGARSRLKKSVGVGVDVDLGSAEQKYGSIATVYGFGDVDLMTPEVHLGSLELGRSCSHDLPGSGIRY